MKKFKMKIGLQPTAGFLDRCFGNKRVIDREERLEVTFRFRASSWVRDLCCGDLCCCGGHDGGGCRR